MSTKKETKIEKVEAKPVKKKRRAPRKKKDTSITMPSPVDSSIQIVVASELADDQMIEQEMMGNVLQHFIYQFEQDNKPVVGLTVKGVSEVVRRINANPKSGSKIRLNPQYLVKEECERDGQKGIEVSVYAEDLVTGNSAWGIKFEPYKKSGRNGTYSNTFAVEKALSKAERNAKRKLIPEVMATKIIKKLIAENPENVKQITPPAYQTQAIAPKAPIASTPEEKMLLIRKAIKTQKNQSAIITIMEKTQASDEFSEEFKAEISNLASTRVDELETQ